MLPASMSPSLAGAVAPLPNDDAAPASPSDNLISPSGQHGTVPQNSPAMPPGPARVRRLDNRLAAPFPSETGAGPSNTVLAGRAQARAGTRQPDDASPVEAFARPTSPSRQRPGWDQHVTIRNMQAGGRNERVRLNLSMEYFDGMLAHSETTGVAAIAGTAAPDAAAAQAFTLGLGLNTNSDRSQWRFDEGEPGAISFNLFQARLGNTMEFMHDMSREGMTRRVDTVVSAMRSSAPLRALCFTHAEEALGSCGDRLALALNQMETAKLGDDAQSGRLGTAALFASGTGLMKLRALDKVADEKIAWFKAHGIKIDEVEVRLGYQVGLGQRLALPAMAPSMLYMDLSGISPEEMQGAAEIVEAQCSGPALAAQMAQWEPWRDAMQRAHPAPYQALAAAHAGPREHLSWQPDGMSHLDYKQACAELMASQQAQVDALTERLTHDYMDVAVNPAPPAKRQRGHPGLHQPSSVAVDTTRNEHPQSAGQDAVS